MYIHQDFIQLFVLHRYFFRYFIHMFFIKLLIGFCLLMSSGKFDF